MNCSRCGIDLFEESKFCHNCGFPVGKTEEYLAETEMETKDSREFNAKLIYQPGDDGSYIKIVASDLGLTNKEFEDLSLEDIARIIGGKENSVKEVNFDSGELMLLIFSAWR